MARREGSIDFMDGKDIRALYRVARIHGQDVDINLFLHGLLRQGFITRKKYETLVEIFNNTAAPLTNRYESCLREIAQFMTLQNIVSVFRDIGLQDIAQAILTERYCEPVKQIQPSKCENQDLMEDLNVMVIQELASGRTNMHVYFEDMTQYCIRKLQQTEEIRQRQRFMDCLAIVVCMRRSIVETKTQNEAILDQLMSVKETHKDLDHTASTVAYLTSKVHIASTYSMDGGETFLNDAKQVCHHCDNNYLKSITYTTEQALYRRIYSQTNDANYHYKCVFACDNAAYTAMASETRNYIFLYKSIFLINKLFAVLVIGSKLIVDPSKELNPSDIEIAKAILRLITPHYSDLGNKWKAAYRVCMARAYEHENSKLALSNAEMAVELETSAYFTELEKQNIKEYIEHLKSKV